MPPLFGTLVPQAIVPQGSAFGQGGIHVNSEGENCTQTQRRQKRLLSSDGASQVYIKATHTRGGERERGREEERERVAVARIISATRAAAAESQEVNGPFFRHLLDEQIRELEYSRNGNQTLCMHRGPECKMSFDEII